MKTKMEMYLDKDTIRFKGVVAYREEETKEIVVDGEVYRNKKTVSKCITIEDMRKDEWMNLHFQTFEYELPGFGVIAKIEDNNVFYKSLADMSRPKKYFNQSWKKSI